MIRPATEGASSRPSTEVECALQSRLFAVSARGLVAVGIMHRIAAEMLVMLRGVLSSRRKVTVISVAVVVTMIDVPIEMLGSMEPGTSADEDAAGEPLRAIVAVRSAVVWWHLIVSIGTNRSRTYADTDLR